MKAEEARRITDANIPPFENILKSIEDCAKQGHSFSCVPKPIESYQIKLINLGFKVSSFTYPMGFDFTKIEW